MAISGAGQTNQAQHAQQMHNMRETEAMRDRDQVSAGLLGTNNSVSNYSGFQIQSNSSALAMPIAAPNGQSSDFSTMDTNELQALLGGMRAESDEVANQNAQENIRVNKDRVDEIRDRKISNLTHSLDPAANEQKDQCATALIVVGSLLLPMGAMLIAQGVQAKQEIGSADGHNAMMSGFYGEGLSQVGDFENGYAKDFAAAEEAGEPLDPSRHLQQLDGLKNQGIIGEQLHGDLSAMVRNGEKPEMLHTRLLEEAVANHVDNYEQSIEQGVNLLQGESGSSAGAVDTSRNEAMSNMEFQQQLAQMAAMMEEEEEVMRQIEADLQNSVSTIITGQQSGQAQSAQQSNFI